MTFTEHTSLLHVVDARTFETEEIIQVPTIVNPIPSDVHPPQVPTQPHRQSRIPLIPHRHTLSPQRINSTPPPRYVAPRRNGYQAHPQIVQALGDTFRIYSPYSAPSSISDSTWRALRMNDPSVPEEDYRDILVIPPLGDREVESDVQALLGGHGIRTRQQRSHDHDHDEDPNTGSTHGDYEYTPSPVYPSSRRSRDDEMEIDELESDCISSRTPSRSSSPSPSTHVPTMRSPSSGRLSLPPNSSSASRTGSVSRLEVGYEDNLDIAGTCFDPSGEYIYVASKEAVVEWSVAGADKRWWFENGWM